VTSRLYDSRPLRLLFLTETVPFPLDSGGRIKTYNTLRLLSRRHEVHCHALARHATHLTHRDALARNCASVALHHVPRSWRTEVADLAWSQITQSPFVVRRHFHRHVLARLRDACREHVFDLVYCDHLSMLEYGRRLPLPVVLDAHNVEFAIVQRYAATLGWSPVRAYAELEWRRLRRYERRQYPSCELIYSVSETDAGAIHALSGASNVVVLPIVVDMDALPHIERLTADPEILFVGGLHWPPNADAVRFFVREILPLVRRRAPSARLTVVGRDPGPTSSQLGPLEGVRFVGHVHDVEPFFQSSRVMVTPIRSGSGMRVKILDALARGLPVVTTRIGCEGIAVSDGHEALVADAPDAFADHVVRVLQDDRLATAMADAGRRLARARYDLSSVADELDRTLVRARRAMSTAAPEPAAAAAARSRP
jgi:glycosyltransferase involved in cell wall biosynthesis